MAGPPRPMNLPLMLGGAGGANNQQIPHPWQQALQQSQRQQTQPNVPMQPTALPMTPNHKFELAQGLASTYASMHQRFDQGDLARSIEQEHPMDTLPMMADPFTAQGMPMSHAVTPVVHTTPMMQNTILKTQNTPPETQYAKPEPQDSIPEQQATPTIEMRADATAPEKKKKPKKIAKTEREGTPGGSALKQGPRCAKCIKSHKRCAHRVQQSLTPQPVFDASFVTSSPANYLPATGAPEDHSPALPTLQDSSFAVQAEHADMAAMPTGVAPTNAATTKRKR